MDNSASKQKSLGIYMGRAVILAFIAGFLLTTVLMFIAGGMFARVGAGTYDLGLGPFVFFQAIKENLDGGGTSVALAPGLGVFVLLVVFPAAAGTATYFIKKKQAAKTGRTQREETVSSGDQGRAV